MQFKGSHYLDCHQYQLDLSDNFPQFILKHKEIVTNCITVVRVLDACRKYRSWCFSFIKILRVSNKKTRSSWGWNLQFSVSPVWWSLWLKFISIYFISVNYNVPIIFSIDTSINIITSKRLEIRFVMPRTWECWLRLVHSCVYCARQTCKIYYVLPYSVDFNAPGELWNQLSKTVKLSFVWSEGPVNTRKTTKQLVRRQINMILFFDTVTVYISLHFNWGEMCHYGDVIMGAVVSQITSVSMIYSIVCLGADQENVKAPCHRHLWGKFTGDRLNSKNSPHKWLAYWKMFQFDDVIMSIGAAEGIAYMSIFN